MQRSRRILLLTSVIVLAVFATIVLTGTYADFDSPAFQRVALRLLAIAGLGAVIAMFTSLVMRADGMDHLSPARVRPTRRVRIGR